LKPEDTKVMKAVETPKDITIEQEYLATADAITFNYPILWAGLPAIFKGYVDRVFSYGFACGSGKMLKGKKGFMISTFGAPKEIYDKSGMTDGLKITSDTGIFDYGWY
jgi:NAD(P)H dehydrogenase (quinone)